MKKIDLRGKIMLKLRHIPEIYCSNCNEIIDASSTDDCCKYCHQPYIETFRNLILRKDVPSDKKAWAHYFIAKDFESKFKDSRLSYYFDNMIKNYWNAVFLGCHEAERDLAMLFEYNDDEFSLSTAVFLAHAIDGDWPKEYLKMIRETDPQKLLEIASDFENKYTLENHREIAYKFYRKAISSSKSEGIYAKCRAMVELVQMLLFDKHHYDDMYNEKSCTEPQIGAEIAFWLKTAMKYGEETTKVKATELYAKAKERFGTNSILLEFFN